MSDPRQDAELHVGDNRYMLRFTNSALVKAEQWTGKDVRVLFMVVMSGNIGMADLAALTAAGLEGARRKLRLGGQPWTPEKASDLLDDADDFDTVAEPVIEAWDAAMRKWFPPVEEDDAEDPQTAAGDGTTSFEPPSA